MSNSGGFQVQVGLQPAVAIAGNRASQNPIFDYPAGPGGLVAGSSLFVGRFAWVTPPIDPNGTDTLANSFGNGAPQGFMMLNQQALNTTFLSYAGMQVQPGAQTSLKVGGDFWVVNSGSTEAVPGQKAFAFVASGLVAFAAAGTVFGGASATASSIAASTFSVTASIAAPSSPISGAGSIMTVTTVGSGTVVVGGSISGTGIPTAPAPTIYSQLLPLLAGEAVGGIGRYQLDTGEVTFASGTVSGTYGTLTIGTLVGSVTFAVGDVLTGSGVTANTFITANIAGTGGTGGTMVVNKNTVVSSTTITASLAVETAFIARSSGLNGEPVYISSFKDAGNN
jgi:hypothetical protein